MHLMYIHPHAHIQTHVDVHTAVYINEAHKSLSEYAALHGWLLEFKFKWRNSPSGTIVYIYIYYNMSIVMCLVAICVNKGFAKTLPHSITYTLVVFITIQEISCVKFVFSVAKNYA